MKSQAKDLRDLTEEQGAVVVVQFAIVAFVLFMLLFAFIEYRRIYKELGVLDSAAREGARVAAVGGTPQQIEDAVNRAATPYVPHKTPVADNLCTASTSGETVRVSWHQPLEVSIGPLPPFTKDVEVKGSWKCE
jgi:Flp pilus assembly protein TadG